MSSEGLLTRPGFLWRVVEDRLNPVLVKEVRQALRGRFFRVAFICTLIAVTLVGAMIVANMGQTVSASEVREYFATVFAFLVIAVVGLVPFSTFTAMGAEWEENTYDLLTISNLRPRQVVWGKLLASGVQTLLYFSVFTPFLVLAFLFRSIDIQGVAFLLAGALGVSALASTVALCLSTFSRVRFVRAILLAALAGLLSMVVIPAGPMAHEVLRGPFSLMAPRVILITVVLTLQGILLLAFAFLTACNMLAHPEENRSTNMRLLAGAALLVGIGFCWWMTWFVPTHLSGKVNRDEVMGMGMALLVAISVPAIFFVTERESLGRRVALRVPRGLGLAALASPLLPGGSRGVLLWMVQAGLVTFLVFVAQTPYSAGSKGFLDDGMAAYLALLLYCATYLLLPSAVLAPYASNGRLRAAARLLIPSMVLLCAFLPSIAGFFLRDHKLMAGEHAGNPFHLLEELWERPSHVGPGPWLLLGGAAGLALLLNLRRLWVGFRELGAARTSRARHEDRRAAYLARSGDAVAQR